MGMTNRIPIGILAAMKPSEAIEKLIAAGMTEAAIGQAVDCRQSTINKIKHGMVPNWETGKALVDLAAALPANDDSIQDAAA